MRKLGLILATSILWSLSARAQIINIEDQRHQWDTIGWFGQFNASFATTEYLSSLLSLRGGARVDYSGSKQAWVLLGSYQLVQSNSNTILHDGFLHLRYSRELSDKWEWEGFVQTQFSEQLRLELRQLAGTGPRLRVSEKERFSAFVGLLYMFEYDEFQASNTIFRDHRLSSYLSFQWQPSATFTWANTTYYQPLLTNLSSSRVSSVNNFVFRISENFSFQTSFLVTYDRHLAREAENVPNTTYTWSNGLRLSF